MAAYGWTIDAAGTSLNINDATNYFVTDQDVSPPPLKSQFHSTVDTEGSGLVSLGYENRRIVLKLRIKDSTASALEDRIQTLQMAVGKLNREAGTLTLTTPASTTVLFDVLTAQMTTPLDRRYMILNLANEVTLEFDCKPFGRGAEVDLGDNVETTLPWLIFTDTGVGGDVPALGRLVVDEDDNDDQAWMTWGVQSRYYSSASTAALAFQAESLTTMGAGATTATSYSGYSGASYVVAAALTTSYQAILSTQLTGGGAHLSHIGRFHVYGRFRVPSANSGGVTVALEWGVGDYRTATTNRPVELFPNTDDTDGYADQWRIADLGLVNIPVAVAGTQQWEGRVLAKATATNQTVAVDWLILVPVDEGSGVAQRVSSTSTPSALTCWDDFASGTYAGGLVNDTLASGTKTWGALGTPYESDDFAVSGGYAARTAVSDTSTDIRYGRLMVVSGTTTMTTTAVQVELQDCYTTGRRGVLARAVDHDNFLAACLDLSSTSGHIEVWKAVSGTVTRIAGKSNLLNKPGFYNTDVTIRLTVTVGGNFYVSYAVGGTWTYNVLTGSDSVLASGGALDDGSVGMFDHYTSASANTRNYDNFQAWVPVLDAAMFAGQAIEIRADQVNREDSTGNLWQKPSRYEGDYLLLPPAGRESRTCRVIVKASRGLPLVESDTAADDISAQLFATPRYLTVPT